MDVRHLKSVWGGFGLIPVMATLAGQWDFAAGAWGAYLMGWGWFWRATLRDPRGAVINDLYWSPASRVFAGMALVILLLLLIASPKLGLGLLFATALLLLSNWAAADSSQDLQLRLARITLVFVALAACLTTAELSLRLTEFRQPANGEGWTWGHEVRLNALGFREREVVTPKPAETFRVMVLGDSLTWGVGLADEQRYTRLLETQLRESYSAPHIEVLNFGLVAAATVREQQVLARHIDVVDPDLVVVGFCVNDPQPKSQSYAVELDKFRPLFKVYRFVGKYLGATRLANFLHVRTDNVLRNSGLVPGHEASLDRCYELDSAEWQAFVAAIAGIRRTCQTRYLPPPVFIALLQGDGDFNHPNKRLRYIIEWSRQAKRAAQAAGLTVVDLEADFKREGHRDRHVNARGGHPDAECNLVYAAKIAPLVAKHFARHQLASKEIEIR